MVASYTVILLKITSVKEGVMKIKSANEEYIEKAKNLSPEATERLLSRMRGKLTRRAEDKKLSILEALAIQLEFEDAQLAEWRKNLQEIRQKDHDKNKK